MIAASLVILLALAGDETIVLNGETKTFHETNFERRVSIILRASEHDAWVEAGAAVRADRITLRVVRPVGTIHIRKSARAGKLLETLQSQGEKP